MKHGFVVIINSLKAKQIDKLDNTIMVIFNPDSEGYITEAKVMGQDTDSKHVFG